VSSAAPVATETGLWLYVRGLHRLMAMPASIVERALLVDETPGPSWPPAIGPAIAPPGCLGRLAVRGVSYGAWDLGRLLGSEEARRSWILLRLPHGEERLPIALRTDECLHVGVLPRVRRLEIPPGVHRGRTVFRAAFPAADAGGAKGSGALVGFEMELGGLFTDYELEFTSELLRHDD
jgi:hypothetical protein